VLSCQQLRPTSACFFAIIRCGRNSSWRDSSLLPPSNNLQRPCQQRKSAIPQKSAAVVPTAVVPAAVCYPRKSISSRADSQTAAVALEACRPQ